MEIVPGRFTHEAIAPETAELNRAVEQALPAAPAITSTEAIEENR